MTYKRPKPRTKYAGVYGIVSRATGRTYFGSSNDMTGRFTHHRYCLRRGIHKNKPLQDEWDQYGEMNFDFTILFECENYLEMEKLIIDSSTNKFNLPHFTGNSPAHSTAAKRRWENPEYRSKREDFLSNRISGRFVSNNDVVQDLNITGDENEGNVFIGNERIGYMENSSLYLIGADTYAHKVADIDDVADIHRLVLQHYHAINKER